eukprot:CAMPEP_0196805770 /NCGR_PEP_ID=MMETSP1362-20130617/5590_1 /TAXON_ID=163516 /ORGANISM="Leptocylindrus danicus, Strain CCMP1856" /LENGTH=321 /DNA_ID=CAMNT_0042178895 /DNA_START=68 /DNA_END=1030 /DNA_ORIENTATION=-
MTNVRLQSMLDVLTGLNVNEKLALAIAYLGEATAEIQQILSNYVDHSNAYVGTQNASGDDQLHLDVKCDEAVFRAIKASGVVSLAASEETPVETPCGATDGFAIGFDPLDGSSIIGANFSIGSIFGIWPNNGTNTLLGRTGREQVASAVSMYGPRTTICIALPPATVGNEKEPSSSSGVVMELTLVENGSKWKLSRESIKILPSGKVFAPGNLRASNDNANYDKLIKYWIAERYTLRYTGGMVPDVYHIFVKQKGVFCNVSSEKAKAKLRLLYEVAPMGLIVEIADGDTTHEAFDKSVLDVKLDDLDQRLGVCFGSKEEVA